MVGDREDRMLSVMLQATNGRFVTRDAAAPHAVAATAVTPAAGSTVTGAATGFLTSACELLVENLSRPYADTIQVADRLTFRFAASNTLWSVAGRGPRVIDGFRVEARHERFWRPDNFAVFTVADVDGTDPAQPRLRLTAELPERLVLPGANALVRLLPGSASLEIHSELVNIEEIGDDEGWLRVRNHPVHARLRLPDGRLLGRQGTRPELRPGPGTRGTPEQELVFSRVDDAWSRAVRSGQRVIVRTRDGVTLGLREMRRLEFAPAAVPVVLEVTRAAGPGALRHGDVCMLHAVVDGRLRPVRLGAAGLECLTSGEPDRLIFEDRKALALYWNAERADNASLGTTGEFARYVQVREQAQVLIGPAAEAVPLKRFFHSGRGDHFTTATEKGQSDALAVGYRYAGIEGWAYAQPQPGTRPLRLYWNEARGDNLLTGTAEDERSAGAAGYLFAQVEAHAYPALTPETPRAPERPGGHDGPTLRDGVRGVGELGPRLRDVVVRGVEVLDPGVLRREPKKALVLSGGGARGAFEAGVVQALWERGYRPDIITGVSVGALNATVLAQGHDGAADDLVALWRGVSARRAAPRLVAPDAFVTLGDAYRDNHYLNVYATVLERLGLRVRGAVTPATAGIGFGSALLGPLGAFLGGLLGLDSGVGDADERLTRALRAFLVSFHCAHSMEPLRRLIDRTIDDAFLDRLRGSRINLRIGLSNISTGEFFGVSKPVYESGALSRMGLVDPEPDHARGRSWVGQPLYGADFTLLPFNRALYASCALPYFMEPILADLAGARPVTGPDGARIATVPLDIPRELRLLLEASGMAAAGVPDTRPDYLDHLDHDLLNRAFDQILDDFPGVSPEEIAAAAGLDSDGARGTGSRRHYLFDGGLRDTMPIRTALRLGARDITVVAVDRVQQATKTYPTVFRPGVSETSLLDIARFTLPSFGGVDVTATRGFQHVLGLLNVWMNDSARGDVLLAGAHGEFVNWTRRAYAALDARGREALREQARRYFATQRPTWASALGAGTWLGGDGGRSPYGEPLTGDGVTIRYIAPDREVLGALDFDNREGIEEAIALGRERAGEPDVLVSP